MAKPECHLRFSEIEEFEVELVAKLQFKYYHIVPVPVSREKIPITLETVALSVSLLKAIKLALKSNQERQKITDIKFILLFNPYRQKTPKSISNLNTLNDE